MSARERGARKAAASDAPTPAAQRRFAAALAPRSIFLTRIRRAATYAFALVAVTLGIGMIGYRVFENLSWLDAFHQAAMLLSGMGPVADVKSTGGKIFDGIYALFCGVILLASTGLLFAPVIHRLLHRFHIEDARDDR